MVWRGKCLLFEGGFVLFFFFYFVFLYEPVFFSSVGMWDYSFLILVMGCVEYWAKGMIRSGVYFIRTTIYLILKKII